MPRYYEINGVLMTSVTTALSIIRQPWLETWRGIKGNSEADRIRDEAAEFGTEVHDWCNRIVSGGLAYPHPLAETFEEWFNAYVKEVILAEEIIWQSTYKYAGRPDLVALIKGDRAKPTLIDFKTTYMITQEMGLQLAAYKEALKEQRGIEVRRRMILHLDKKDFKLTTKEFTNDSDFNMFLYALSLYKYLEGGTLNGKDCEIIKCG